MSRREIVPLFLFVCHFLTYSIIEKENINNHGNWEKRGENRSQVVFWPPSDAFRGSKSFRFFKRTKLLVDFEAGKRAKEQYEQRQPTATTAPVGFPRTRWSVTWRPGVVRGSSAEPGATPPAPPGSRATLTRRSLGGMIASSSPPPLRRAAPPHEDWTRFWPLRRCCLHATVALAATLCWLRGRYHLPFLRYRGLLPLYFVPPLPTRFS